MVVHVEPLVQVSTACAPDQVTPARHRVEVVTPASLHIRVEVAEGVRWNLRVEQ